MLLDARKDNRSSSSSTIRKADVALGVEVSSNTSQEAVAVALPWNVSAFVQPTAETAPATKRQRYNISYSDTDDTMDVDSMSTSTFQTNTTYSISPSPVTTPSLFQQQQQVSSNNVSSEDEILIQVSNVFTSL